MGVDERRAGSKAATALRVIRAETLAGITTSFAMVPEVVGFTFVAGVNPITGLYAAFTAGLVTALWGGRPGLISGGAGSLAVVSAGLVAAHGVEYLFAAVLLMGIVQALVGLLKLGSLIEFVPHPVMIGFVNGLATVIFIAQLRQIPWHGPNLGPTLGMIALTIAIMAFLPRVSKLVPSALVAIACTTGVVGLFHLPVRRVSDLGSVRGAFPALHIPVVPITWGTLQIVLPYAVILAGVGLTESLLTQSLVDEITETNSSHNRECVGQGLSNIVTGLFAGMGGCAMIGQTMINLDSGGRHRLSGIVEALTILAFILVASSLIGAVPTAALVGVMLVVVFRTFAWKSFLELRTVPKSDAAVMIVVAVVTVLRDLATAVAVGVVLSALHFVKVMARHLSVERVESPAGEARYEARGLLFFGTAKQFLGTFQTRLDPEVTTLDLSGCHVMGQSATEALESISRKYAKAGKSLRVVGLESDAVRLLRTQP